MVGNGYGQAHNLPQTFCFGTLSDGQCRFIDSFAFVFSRYEKSIRVSTSVISASKKLAQKNVKTLNISIKMPKSLRKTPEISIKRPFGQVLRLCGKKIARSRTPLFVSLVLRRPSEKKNKKNYQ